MIAGTLLVLQKCTFNMFIHVVAPVAEWLIGLTSLSQSFHHLMPQPAFREGSSPVWAHMRQGKFCQCQVVSTAPSTEWSVACLEREVNLIQKNNNPTCTDLFDLS